MEKQVPLAKVMLYQSVGFLAIMALIWLDELIALPSLIFGEESLILDFRESALKMLLVLTVWFVVGNASRRVLTRVRYLEGFMRICAWCHHIHFKDKWISMADFLQQSFDTPTTHGICPICLAKQQAAVRKAKQKRAAEAKANSKAPVT